jgi:ABC-2 type transport system ATP-binding protein
MADTAHDIRATADSGPSEPDAMPGGPRSVSVDGDRWAISARGLSRAYGGGNGIQALDLDVAPGTILGVIGPSGCGKTTLLRVLAGVTAPTAGDVTVLGRAPRAFTAADRARLGYLPQMPVLFPNLSVWRNLNFVASLYGVGLRRRRRLRDVLRFVDLLGDRHKRFRSCSGGMKRRLALAATLVHDPELLLLDEPTAGVDPLLRERFWEHFRALRDAGRTLVVATQYVGEAAMCDRVAVMADGRLLVVGSPGEIRRRAFGGDLVQVWPSSGWLSRSQLGELAAEPWARSVSQGAEVVTIVVDDAVEGARLAREHFAGRGIAVDAVEDVVPSYDDAFVRLIEQADDAAGDGTSSLRAASASRAPEPA